MTTLHALPDFLHLHASGNTQQSEGLTIITYYYLTDPSGNYLVDASALRLTDPSGNYLTDPSGNYLTTTKNRLVGGVQEIVYPLILHTIQDDLNLTAE
jgi:hypothetical protein